jgi:hypothetical protein
MSAYDPTLTRSGDARFGFTALELHRKRAH